MPEAELIDATHMRWLNLELQASTVLHLDKQNCPRTRPRAGARVPFAHSTTALKLNEHLHFFLDIHQQEIRSLTFPYLHTGLDGYLRQKRQGPFSISPSVNARLSSPFAIQVNLLPTLTTLRQRKLTRLSDRT